MTVSADGTVKGIKKGSVTIAIKAYNGLTRTVALTVVDAPGFRAVERAGDKRC